MGIRILKIKILSTRIFKKKQNLLLLVAIWLLFFLGCTQDINNFLISQNKIITQKNFSWTNPIQISVHPNSSYIANADNSSFCKSNTNSIISSSGAGCMQAPSMQFLEDDSLMLTLFTQTNSSNFPKFGIFSILNLIDSLNFTNFYNVDQAVIDSARHIQSVKLSNGDILAVFMVESSGVRRIYANIFNHITKTWNGAIEIGNGSGVNTDTSTDGIQDGGGNDSLAVFCRPKVSAAKDGSAMIVWCDDNSGPNNASLYYNYYSAGVWSGPQKFTSLSTPTTLYFPGFAHFNVVILGTFSANDTITFNFDFLKDGVLKNNNFTLTAKNGVPSSNQEFQIVYDTLGNKLVCKTIDNLLNQLASLISNYTNTNNLYNYMSFKKDTSCTDTLTLCSGSNCKIHIYFNKALNPVFFDNQTTTTYNGNILKNVNSVGFTAGLFPLPDFPQDLSYKSQWVKSTGAAIAGDKYGNYIVARVGVSPIFKDTQNANGLSDIGFARPLFGHIYKAGSGFEHVNNNSILPEKTFRISREPKCEEVVGNLDRYKPCSVRNPKALMSDEGRGLVLYYQNQFENTDSTIPMLQNPTRLMYSTYSLTSGFSSTAGVLDVTTVCDGLAQGNSAPVCEVGSYLKPCMTFTEYQTINNALSVYNFTTLSLATLDHDFSDIPAQMNSEGQAIIAYHKPVNTGTLASPNCTQNIGLMVRFYDPILGFSNQYQVDSGLGLTMHASVDIDEDGNAAIVWEEVVGSNVYLKVRFYDGENFSPIFTLVSTTTTQTDSMMPSIKLAKDGVVFVSYSFGLASSTTSARKQYMVKYVLQ